MIRHNRRARMMRRTITILTLAAMIVGVIALSPTPARADAGISSWTLACNSLSITGSTSAPYVGIRLARGTNVDLPHPDDIIYDSFFRGNPIFGTSGGNYTIYVTFPYQIPGQTLTFRVFGAFAANGTAWDNGAFQTITAQCSGPAVPFAPTLIPVGGSPAVGAPTGATARGNTEGPGEFHGREILCDTPLYESPGGKEIPNTRLLRGQSWLTGSNVFSDSSGALWAAVQIGGYIPASCVSGLVAGGATGTTTISGLPEGTIIVTVPVNEFLDTSGTTYIVKAGDTLFLISLKFGVSMRTLARVNNISNINLIYVGQKLYIP